MERLIVPATLDALSVIGQYVKTAAAEAGLDKSAAYALRLAIDEIATNIILYGYERAQLQGELAVDGELTDAALTITLEDTGIAFDPRAQTLPDEEDLTKPLEERAIGGLGIYLAFRGVDHFDYQRVDERNRNIFVMWRTVEGMGA